MSCCSSFTDRHPEVIAAKDTIKRLEEQPPRRAGRSALHQRHGRGRLCGAGGSGSAETCRSGSTRPTCRWRRCKRRSHSRQAARRGNCSGLVTTGPRNRGGARAAQSRLRASPRPNTKLCWQRLGRRASLERSGPQARTAASESSSSRGPPLRPISPNRPLFFC